MYHDPTTNISIQYRDEEVPAGWVAGRGKLKGKKESLI